MPGRILVFACCLLASLARSEPRHAITLYDEPAKYPPGFQHFDFVDPQAPKGGELRLVANSFLKYPPLIERHLGPCRTLAEGDGFRIYSARRS